MTSNQNDPTNRDTDASVDQQDDIRETENPAVDEVQPESAETAAQTDDVQDLKAQIENAEAEIAQLKDQVLRSHAESENIRRRAESEVTKARQFSIKSFADSLVPVKDSLEAALAQKDQSLEALTQGVETTLKQLTAAFDKNNLKEIAPGEGDKFDPNLHQAVASVPHESVASNCVIETMQKGYLLGDRVIRAAMVSVSAGK